MANMATGDPRCKANTIPTHFDLFDKAEGNVLTLSMWVHMRWGTLEVINVGVKPAVAAGVGLL